MDLKEFLRPTKIKIILFVVLALLTFGSKMISDTYGGICTVGETGGTV